MKTDEDKERKIPKRASQSSGSLVHNIPLFGRHVALFMPDGEAVKRLSLLKAFWGIDLSA